MTGSATPSPVNRPAPQPVPQRKGRATGPDRAVAVPTSDLPWTDRLIELHHAVRAAVLRSGRESVGVANAKGVDV